MRNLLRHLVLLLGLAAAGGASAGDALPRVDVGRVERLASFASRFVAARHVDVWLPPGYSPARRYPVLYMHDGQMLFDARTTWNHQAWDVHEAAARLARAGRVPEVLIVGVWNRPDGRYADYFPQKALDLAPAPLQAEYRERAAHGRMEADAYLRFLVEELKPAIDARYATRPEAASTFVMGSSMGGLISLYALCEYPQVFGGAAALSAHWVGLPTSWGLERARNGALPLALLNYLSGHLPDPAGHRLWLDRGDDALDGLYAPALAMAGELLRDHGYGPDAAAVRVYPGRGHKEVDWAARLDEVLAWLLSPPR